MPLEYSSGDGDAITCNACVAYGVNDLRPAQVEVAYPKAGEVRLRVVANALCHTDCYTLEGLDPEGLFPCVLGHEAGAIVEAVGEGVEGLAVGDAVIPCYTPQCRENSCIFCQNPKTNLCPAIRSTQGQGVMPDGTTRLRLTDESQTPLFHFMGTSTFAEYTVVAAISCAKINPEADLKKMCLLGCGVATGWGAAANTAKVEEGSSVAVFGLGAVGLAVVQMAKKLGAAQIYGVDINPGKFAAAEKMGATQCLNPTDYDKPIQKVLAGDITKWGIDFTFDCTGNTTVMRSALECAHRGWGVSTVIGVAASGHEIGTRPFQMITGRVWKGTAFGGYKSRDSVPALVESVMKDELPIDDYITHRFNGVEKMVDAVEALHGGECLRAVVEY